MMPNTGLKRATFLCLLCLTLGAVLPAAEPPGPRGPAVNPPGNPAGAHPKEILFIGPQCMVDAPIDASRPTANLGSAPVLSVGGQSPHAHAVLKVPGLIGNAPFQVPPGATVQSAVLEVRCTNSGNVMKVYQLLEDWKEGEVTWSQRAANLPWSEAGADGPASHAAVGVNADCTATGLRTIDLTAMVQAWASGQPNHGIVFTDGGADGVGFDASESLNPPVLRVRCQRPWTPAQTQPEPREGPKTVLRFNVPNGGYVLSCPRMRRLALALFPDTRVRVEV